MTFLRFRSHDSSQLLLAIGSRPGNTVLDSVCPLVAPHIIITEPPPQDPWIAYNNATNDPQDCAFGNRLVVPSRLVSYVNDYANDDSSKFHHGDANLTNEEASVSPADTPAPGTPIFEGYDDSSDPFLHRLEYDDELGDTIQALDVHYSACGMDLEDLMTRPTCDIFAYEDDEDEDDGLPPFDDWYLTIMERTSGLELS